jgi:hypothetical protein
MQGGGKNHISMQNQQIGHLGKQRLGFVRNIGHVFGRHNLLGENHTQIRRDHAVHGTLIMHQL